MKTRISVIIPVYNVQEFLDECVESVINQTINNMPLTDGYERNLQIILVDDGSTDDSAIIAKAYDDKYENIEYRYEENQGLGHARNYGCTFAEGDYIIFIDSDDIVSPKAYELMYKAAVENDADMSIGAVNRFNSKGYWASNIHDTAFNGTDLVSHVSENPNLLYDTTSWNKLIRRSFWETHNFQFPEGILYEDIPVTVPMHFMANKVAIVRELCYHWRVREGISKSITQTTDDLKTLNDRLYVLSLVDEFFEKNVTDPVLWKTKTLKYLKVDLMIFVNKLKSVQEESAYLIMDALNKYIDEHIDKSLIDELNEFEQLKYKYLMDNDFNKLLDVMNFEYSDASSTVVKQKGDHFYMDVPSNVFGTSSLCVDKFLLDGNIYRIIEEVKITKKNFKINGFALIPGIANESFDERELSFSLVNCETRKTIPLEYKNRKSVNISSYNLKYLDSFSYDGSGFNVIIPFEKIGGNPDFLGENRIMVTFKQHNVTHNYYLGRAKKSARTISKDKARIFNNSYISIDYDFNNEIIIKVSPVKHIFKKMYLDNNCLCLNAETLVGSLVMYYPADSINSASVVPFDYDTEKKRYSIAIKNLLSKKGQVQYDDGTPAIYENRRFMTFISPVGQCTVNCMRDFYMDVEKKDTISLVKGVRQTEKHVYITTQYCTVGDNVDVPTKAVIYYKDAINVDVNPISTSKCSVGDDNVITCIFRINMSKESFRKNLFNGAHDFVIDYNVGDDIVSTLVYIEDGPEFYYKTELYDYKIYRSKFGNLRVMATQKWGEKEDTPIKRLKNAENKYKWYRRLPIKKKRIMFESMWGAKYSCNPRFLYEYIDANHPEYECIWSLNDEHTPIKGKGKRVRRNSLKYLYYLATSKYLVNNVNFHNHYVKRNGQVFIQTMHGTPLKTLGLDVPGDFHTTQEEEKYIKKCNYWDYLTVQSDFVSEISKKCFLYKKEFLPFGYPRTDILYSKNNPDDISKLKKKMGIPLDKKVILYAPTWRIKNTFDLMLNLDSLKKKLSDEYVLILRLHHFSVKGWIQPEQDDFVYDFSKYDSVEELYLVSDLLITDYSSVMFDYAVLDRPIIIFAYDLEEYGDKLRGFYIDIEEDKPGPIVYTSREVEKAIINLEETEALYKPCRDKFRKKFVQYECENSSEKIFNEVFKK